MTYRFPIRKGDRVALAPHTDLWMAGCRFGTVTSVVDAMSTMSERYYYVELDTGLNTGITESDLLGALGDHTSASDSTIPAYQTDESGTYGLDDCVYWDRPEADCSGRMGTTRLGRVICEHHYNHPPQMSHQ